MTQYSQSRTAEESVFKIHGIVGDFPGYRALHTDGRLWVPVAGVRSQPAAALAEQETEVLYRELDARLEDAAVEFDLVLELSEPGDPLDDPTALWPEDRRRVAIGGLTVEGPISEAETGDPVINQDLTALTDGIEPTDDPILQIRRGVPEVSAAGRSGGWQARAPGRAGART